MAEWKKFEGTQEQIAEMRDAKHGWIVRFTDGEETNPETGDFSENFQFSAEMGLIKEYLICEPLPHAEMRARHAMTGQPVYWENTESGKWNNCHGEPLWCNNIVYSFNLPKEEKKFIEVRDYLSIKGSGVGSKVRKSTLHKDDYAPEDLENYPWFIKWIDTDWRKVEI